MVVSEQWNLKCLFSSICDLFPMNVRHFNIFFFFGAFIWFMVLDRTATHILCGYVECVEECEDDTIETFFPIYSLVTFLPGEFNLSL